ncbi:MAG: nucleotidyltransferase, partial [Aquificota bacterium]
RNYMGLKNYLENLTGIKVDLVIKESVRKELKTHIYGEAISV